MVEKLEPRVRSGAKPDAAAASDADQPRLEAPADMPALVDFDAMTPFETDGTSPNTFAIDPASISLQPHYALATIAARSLSGAVTTGHYGFACQHLQYRLLAYPGMDGQWRRSSNRVQWRDLHDGNTHNRQFRAVYNAVCRLGGHSAPSTSDVMRHLSEGRRQPAG